MRISNIRYSRDRDRYDLAYRMMQFGARPQTVAGWTRLSLYQIRILADEYPEFLERHRGRPPKSIRWFWKVRRRLEEAALLGSLFKVLDLLPTTKCHGGGSYMTLSRGVRLCEVFQIYRTAVERPAISFEYLLLLFGELACGESVAVDKCAACGAAALIDVLSLSARVCGTCKTNHRDDAARPISDPEL